MKNMHDKNLITIKVNKEKMQNIIDYFIFVYESYPPGDLESLLPAVRHSINENYKYAVELKGILNAN